MVVSFLSSLLITVDDSRERNPEAHIRDLESNPNPLNRDHLSGFPREMNKPLRIESPASGLLQAIPTRVGVAYLRGWFYWEVALH